MDYFRLNIILFFFMILGCYMYTKNELAYFMRAKDLFVVLIAETWADEERLKIVK